MAHVDQVLITIDLGNDAFTDDRYTEIARILKTAANRIERDGETDFRLRDNNGNTVGAVRIISQR